MWRLPKQTGPSRGPRQPRGLDPRCGARAAPRTRPPHRPDWQRPFRDGRAGRSRGPCRRPAAIAGGAAGLACRQRPVRERVGEELERRLRRAGVFRSPERARELGAVTAAASGAGQASVVRPPVGAGPLGAAAARCASPRAGVGHGLERGARVVPWRGAMASMTTQRRECVGFCACPRWRARWLRGHGSKACCLATSGARCRPGLPADPCLRTGSVGPAVQALQSRNSPISEPMAKGPRFRLGLTGRCSTSGSERRSGTRCMALSGCMPIPVW